MRAKITQIGNSQGIRIPKVLLEESGLVGEVEIEVCSEGLLIKRTRKPRSTWDAAFSELAETDADHGAEAVAEAAGAVYRKEWRW